MPEGKKIRDRLEKFLPHPPDIADWADGFICQSERFNDWLGKIARDLPRRIRAENEKIAALEKECKGEKTRSGRKAAFAAAAKKLSGMKENHKGLFGITFHFDPGPVVFDEMQITESPNFLPFIKACRDIDVRLHYLAQNPMDDGAGIDMRTNAHKLGDIYFIVDASLPFEGSAWDEKILELEEDEKDAADAIHGWIENRAVPPVAKRDGDDVKRGRLRLVSKGKNPDKPVL